MNKLTSDTPKPAEELPASEGDRSSPQGDSLNRCKLPFSYRARMRLMRPSRESPIGSVVSGRLDVTVFPPNNDENAALHLLDDLLTPNLGAINSDK